MSNQPTVATLAAKAIELVGDFTDAVARNFIRTNNIRSMSKLESLVENLKNGTDNISNYAVDAGLQAQSAGTAAAEGEAKPKKAAPKKSAAKEAKAKAEPKAKAEKKFDRKGREGREVTLIEPGVRGFRFGDKWNESVMAGEGIAFRPQNINKLKQHAESLGVAESIIASGDAAKIGKSLAAKLQKQQAAE